jgi:predicted membrane channel-forming protein YqfA (hemolysin III family)
MENQENTLNVRRLVGGIFLAIGAVSSFFTASSYSSSAMFGVVREFQQFVYFFAAWGLGLAIWYLVTLKKAPNRKAEKIVKIIFFIVVGVNVIFAFMNDMATAGGIGIALIIAYSIGCPWGKQGYAKHPYPTESDSKKAA